MTPSTFGTPRARRIASIAVTAVAFSASVAACGSSGPTHHPSTVAQLPSTTAPVQTNGGGNTASGKHLGTATHEHATAPPAVHSKSSADHGKQNSSPPTPVRVSAKHDADTQTHHGTTGTKSATRSNTSTSTTETKGAPKTVSQPAKPTTTTRHLTKTRAITTITTPSPTKSKPHGSGTTDGNPIKKKPPTVPTHSTTTLTPVATTPTSPSTTSPAPTMTTMAGLAPGQPSYSGLNPAHCLEMAGLTNVRPGVQNNTWIGNFGNTPPTDSTALVLLTGPYADQQTATSFASSLQAIPELATASGRWVASAAATSHLDFQVNTVAQCMGSA